MRRQGRRRKQLLDLKKRRKIRVKVFPITGHEGPEGE